MQVRLAWVLGSVVVWLAATGCGDAETSGATSDVVAVADVAGGPLDGTGDGSAPDAGLVSGDVAHPDAVADVPTILDSAPVDTFVEPPVGVTWHGEVRRILEVNCTVCHLPGGIGPFALDTFEMAAATADAVAWAVASGAMPPWPPAGDCRDLEHQRVLTPLEIATLEAWAADGAPEGDPASYIPPEDPPVSDLGPADLTIDAGAAYVANSAWDDDYRCLVLDAAVDEEIFIRAIDVEPDNGALVHHVLVHAIEPEDAARLIANDDASPGLGYTCFGGPAAGKSQLIGAWVPGMLPLRFPEGSAIRVEKGGGLVMQVHYNLLGATGDPAPDRTKVTMWTLPDGQKPNQLVGIYGFANGGIVIPPGEPESVHTKRFAVPPGAVVIGQVPHMHLLGRSISADLVRADGTRECLINVPRWDFDWQQVYLFEKDQRLTTSLGDELELTCVYDNTAENQPLVDGEVRAPRLVTWGEGTLDEMCLNYALALTPFVDAAGGSCAGAVSCIEGCPTGDTACFLACVLGAGGECPNCMLTQLGTCAASNCPVEAAAIYSCLDGCSGGTQTCLVGVCAVELDSLYGCIEGPMRAGTCDAVLGPCEAAFGE